MIQKVLVVASLIMVSFTPMDKSEVATSENQVSAKVAHEVAVMNEIITWRLQKAESLEAQAAVLRARNPQSLDADALSRQAKLERMATLKYRAAIAAKLQ